MRKIVIAAVAAALTTGSLLSTQTAYAAQVEPPVPPVYTQPAQPSSPSVQPLDCQGTTGGMGCGPGWIWRDGWRGWACYPC